MELDKIRTLSCFGSPVDQMLLAMAVDLPILSLNFQSLCSTNEKRL